MVSSARAWPVVTCMSRSAVTRPISRKKGSGQLVSNAAVSLLTGSYDCRKLVFGSMGTTPDCE